jgi:DNA-binding transcriptional LysR family regulator
MADPLETSELLAFSRTVEAHSLSRAAAELGLPRATVSRRLQRMEQRLGVRLLRRTTRKLSLTAAGEALYQRTRGILDAIDEAERSVRHSDDVVRGRLRVSVPTGVPGTFFDLMSRFIARYPDLRIDVLSTARHVDLLAEGFDVALRAGAAPDSGLMSRTLRRVRLYAVASPGYLAKHGTPDTVRALTKHACILGYTRAELPETHWPLLRGGSARVEGKLYSNDILMRRALASDGRGITLLPSLMADDGTRRGHLVPVLERVVGAQSQLMLVYPERELVPPAVRAFIEAVATWAETALDNWTSPRPKARR